MFVMQTVLRFHPASDRVAFHILRRCLIAQKHRAKSLEKKERKRYENMMASLQVRCSVRALFRALLRAALERAALLLLRALCDARR